MNLIPIWSCDKQKVFNLQNSFENEENGFYNNAYGLTFDEFLIYLDKTKANSLGQNLPEGFVPWTAFVLEDNNEYIGIFNFRHYLNDALINGAGHIGYGISKKYRGKGYGYNGLKLLLKTVKDLIPEDEIYMSVNKNNAVSLAVQIKNKAYIHHENDEQYFTRIKKEDI